MLGMLDRKLSGDTEAERGFRISLLGFRISRFGFRLMAGF